MAAYIWGNCSFSWPSNCKNPSLEDCWETTQLLTQMFMMVICTFWHFCDDSRLMDINLIAISQYDIPHHHLQLMNQWFNGVYTWGNISLSNQENFSAKPTIGFQGIYLPQPFTGQMIFISCSTKIIFFLMVTLFLAEKCEFKIGANVTWLKNPILMSKL